MINRKRIATDAHMLSCRGTRHLSGAQEIFLKDVVEPREKIENFENQYGLKNQPTNNFEHLVETVKGNLWKRLHVFENKVRIEIVRLLLQFEMMSLSDITEKLKHIHGWKMSLSGALKHIRRLEDIGIIQHESGGIVLSEPDARKTIYFLEGKERVQKILRRLEDTIGHLLQAGVVFNETAKLARKAERGPRPLKNKERLETLIAQCECEEVNRYLTEDERRKLKSWKIMIC